MFAYRSKSCDKFETVKIIVISSVPWKKNQYSSTNNEWEMTKNKKKLHWIFHIANKAVCVLIIYSNWFAFMNFYFYFFICDLNKMQRYGIK